MHWWGFRRCRREGEVQVIGGGRKGCSGVELHVGWMELFKGMKSGSDVGVVVWSLILFIIFV